MTKPSPSAGAALDSLLADLRRQPLDWRGLLDAARRLVRKGPPSSLALDARRRAALAAVPLAREITEGPAAAESQQAIRSMTIFVAEVCALGLGQALSRCIDRLESLDNPRPFLKTLGVFLDQGGLRRRLTAQELADIGRRLEAHLGDPELLDLVLPLVSFTAAAPAVDRGEAFDNLVLPLIGAAARADRADTMLALETSAYIIHVKLRETQEHYLATLGAMEAAMAALPALPLRVDRRPQTPPRVAFLVPRGDMFAHADLLLGLLNGLSASSRKIVEPLVLIYEQPGGGALGGKLTEIGVEWTAIGPSPQAGLDATLQRARAILADLKVDAVVFVSLSVRIPYFLKRPLAPVQLWWPLKFVLPLYEGLQGRINYGSIVPGRQVIDGRLWRTGPIATPAPTPPDRVKAAAIRDRFQGRKILGTIAREEKIAEPQFLDAVADILDRNGDTVFLWTGRQRLAGIDAVFERRGVADRCHFVGWVDPTTYIEAFDVMLETYPLTGLVVGWAMAMGKPVVSVGDKGWLGVYLEPIFSGEVEISAEDRRRIDEIFAPLAPYLSAIWAKDPSAMAAFADTLLKNPEARRVVAEVQQRYVGTFMLDQVASAEIFAQHLVEVIDETWPEPSGAP